MRIIQQTGNRRRPGGWTLMEILVASAVGTIVMGSLMAVLVFSTRSFIAVANYGILNQSSRFALDMMNRDIRNASQIDANSTTNRLIMTSLTGDKFSYVYDPSTGTLTRNFTNSANTVTTSVLLTNCDVFTFTYYLKVPAIAPSGSYGPYFTSANSAPQNAKLINVDWRCYRTIMGAKQNTESVQTAQITVRN